jgi:DNA modification methylase
MSIADVLSGQARWAIVEGDNIDVLRSLPENSIDIVCGSGPYNQGASPSAAEHPQASRGSSKDWRGYEDDTDCLPEWIYQQQQVLTLDELHRVTKPGGSCFYIHKDRLWDGITLDPADWIKRSEWTIRQRIIWNRGTTHRYDGWHFAPLHEWVFWLTKGPLFGRNLNGAQVWTSIWNVDQPQRYTTPWHPAPYPVALATRCITAMSNPGDVVLDPWSGSGTTGLAALQTNRRYIGIDRQPDYVRLSTARLSAYTRPLALEAA